MTRLLVVLVSVLAVLISGIAAPDAAPGGAFGSAEADTTGADSTQAFPEKMPRRKGWEYAVSAPGLLVYAPFWAVFKITEIGIAAQEEFRIGSRLANIFLAPDGSRGVYPVFSNRSGFGLEFWWKDTPNDRARLNLTGSWGLHGRSLYQARARKIDLFGGALSVGGQATFRNMTNERFYGIGPNTTPGDETNYRIKLATGEVGVGKWVTPRFLVGGIVGIDHTSTGPGKSDDSPSTTDAFPGLPGLNDELTVSRISLGLFYNGANRPVRPTSGLVIEARGRIDQEIGDNNFGYTTSFVDVIRHQGLWRDRTLFLRLGIRVSDPLNNKQIPFYQLSTIGAHETIRGFHRGRFYDFDVALGTVEYRYPISTMIDALLFVDAGQVQQDIFKNFRSNDTQWVFGGGFRVWKKEGTLVRLEAGKSEDGWRFLLLLNPSGERREFSYF